MISIAPIVECWSKSVGVDVLEDDALGEPKLKRKSIGPSTFTVPLPILLVAAMPRKMVEVRSTPMTVDLMSMFFMVNKDYCERPAGQSFARNRPVFSPVFSLIMLNVCSKCAMR